ncbi:MAG: DUF4388 domain-containing protein, partial [Planctomycetota bacterium]
MSLQGSLRQLGLADVLQTALAGRHGNLILRRGATRAVLHVAEDQIHLVEPDPLDPEILLLGFVHRGLLAQETLDAERLRDPDPVVLIDTLVQRGLIPHHDLDAVLRGAAEDAILDLLTWQDGEFRFEEDAEPPEHTGLVTRIGVDIGGMLLRAAQRLDEHNAIAEELGLEALLFIPLDGVAPPVDYEGDPTPTIRTLLDGVRIIDEVAMLCGLTRFAVLRSVFACVRVGAARIPTPEEVEAQAQARVEAGQLKVARGLFLQWASLAPTDLEPLQRLIDLGKRRNSLEEQADALSALGQILLRQGRASEAQQVLRELITLRPGDEVALKALCQAAGQAGDAQQYQRSALELARSALEADEPERTLELLQPLTEGPDTPLPVRVLRARALVRLKNHDGLVSEAEAAAASMGRRARKRDEKEAANFFRDAIAALAPERSDLLKRFRTLREGNRRSTRRLAFTVALVALAATAGVMLWPESPATILTRVEAAWEKGNEAEAARLTTLLQEKHPDSPQAEQAYRMQVAWRQARQPRTPQVTDPNQKAFEAAKRGAEAALAGLPTPEAREKLQVLLDVLSRPGMETTRRRAVLGLSAGFRRTLSRLERGVHERRDTLGRSRILADSPSTDVEVLREYLKRANEARNDGYAKDLGETLDLLSQYMALENDESTQSLLRRVRHLNGLLEDSLGKFDDSLAACQRILALREIEQAYETCRTEASVLLVAGRLDDAQACYQTLGRLLDALSSDPVLQPLEDDVARRRIPQFLHDRESVLAEIRQGLASAAAAEEAGDLENAVLAYTNLAEKFWYIRFENVIELPVRVETTPPGATVVLNGKPVGKTPLVLHRAWATQATMTLRRRGYVPVTRLLGSKRADPRPLIEVALEPTREWTSPSEILVSVRPLEVDGDLLVCDRSGRISLLAGSSGRVRWARQIRTLEGIRGRPVVSGNQITVPFLDGRLVVLDARDGRPLGDMTGGRPAGDLAGLDGTVFLATIDRRVPGFRA